MRSVWTPVKLTWPGGRPILVEQQVRLGERSTSFWLKGAGAPVGDPRIVALDSLPDGSDACAPDGFMFHMMRCGSTAASNLLGAMPRVFSLSEPVIFHALLFGDHDPLLRAVRLRKLMRRHRDLLCGGGGRLVVKWGSLATAFIGRLADAFPAVPRVFIHRDPVEVLVSCSEAPPRSAARLTKSHFAPSLMPEGNPHSLPPGELMARHIGSCCAHAADCPGVSLLEYRDLPDIAWTGLRRHFKLPELSEDTVAALRRESARHAKAPHQSFHDDSREKRTRATPALRSLAEQLIGPEYRRLLSTHPSLGLGTAPASSRHP